jgi:hypothetical protein
MNVDGNYYSHLCWNQNVWNNDLKKNRQVWEENSMKKMVTCLRVKKNVIDAFCLFFGDYWRCDYYDGVCLFDDDVFYVMMT